ncbi:uncharacterized protein CPUR_01888 [Claviceps purpurea 20.1]|uniref:HTH CENPB-type domain-containing protein n=1 Tax=Claviceps purpurea (strain 20.1) TaxID=1111077 RepID=M1W7F0_CLAP2|nr:uncharacterized protein CPUR_01888 [Claviceps purpurea 20.1]
MSSESKVNPDVSPAVKAARDIIISERRPLRSTKSTRLTLRAAAAKHNVSASAIHRQLKSIRLSGRPDYSTSGPGRPKKLKDGETRAVIAYITWLEKSGFYASPALVEEAANTLRAQRTPPEPPVGVSWYRRFQANNPQLEKRRSIRAFSSDHAESDSGDIQELERFYTDLAQVVEGRGITASQIFNADEFGIRIGIVDQLLEVAITQKRRAVKHGTTSAAHREFSTMVGCANAAGSMIPPMVVFKEWPTESWEGYDLDEGIRFARSETGFSNAETSMDWIRHFNRSSFEHTSEAQSRGVTFTDWFGCDEFMRDPDSSDHVQYDPSKNRPEKERIWRLLVLYGFTFKPSLEFMEYCTRFDIEILVPPPKATVTHLTQPLEVGVSRPLKMAHPGGPHKVIRDGSVYFKRSDFIARFQEIISTGFTAHNIMYGFEKSGIFPLDGSAAIHALKEKEKSALATSAPVLQSLPSKEECFRLACEVSRHIGHKYSDGSSPPTPRAHGLIEDVLHEALTLSSFAISNVARLTQ